MPFYEVQHCIHLSDIQKLAIAKKITSAHTRKFVTPSLFVNVFYSLFAGKKAPDNPWGEGATTLEWTLPSPPPYHQFEQLPRID